MIVDRTYRKLLHDFEVIEVHWNDNPTPDNPVRRRWHVTNLTTGDSYLKQTVWSFYKERYVASLTSAIR